MEERPRERDRQGKREGVKLFRLVCRRRREGEHW